MEERKEIAYYADKQDGRRKEKKHSTGPFGYPRHGGFRSDIADRSSVSERFGKGMVGVSMRKISVNVGYYVK